MIDHDGVQWLLATEAARHIPGLEAPTIRQWVTRGKVQGHRIRGRLWVRMPDVLEAEAATRGAYLAQRMARVSH